MFSSTSCLRFSLITGIAGLLNLGSLFGIASSLVAAQSADACQVTNGGFEQADFTGWETIGRARIETSKYGSGPTEGSQQAQLDTFSLQTVDIVELANFLHIGVNDLTNLGEVYEGSALSTTFTVNAGDVLSFDWNFMTDDIQSEGFNDFAFVTLSQAGHTKLADTFSAFPSSLINSTDFYYQTGFKNYTYTFTAGGTYSFGLGVVDVGDGAFDSGLLIDNVSVMRSPLQL
ncbi:MAG: PEP-CTERM sorting domain-containing protein [Cyanobacteriota bacterium]|nr:PEP-CTERM sorting domain-containing protein [Cyanobacteriota bacterium]